MSIKNGVISGDIDISDPYVVTGAPKFEGGYAAGHNAFRAMIPYINKWSPNKPMSNIFSPLNDPFAVMSENEKRACYYGLNPPFNGYAQAADIHSYPEWTTWGWTYDLDPTWTKYDPLHVWNNYNHNSIAPCSVAVTSRETFCAETPASVVLTIPKSTGNETGVIPITSFGQYPGLLTNRYLCLLCRVQGDTNHWAMVTSSRTLGEIWNNGLGGTDSLAIDGEKLNSLRTKWNAGNKFEWWVCASDTKVTTLTEKSNAQLNDAGGITFASLPSDNPEKHYGVSEYKYVNYLLQYIKTKIWGISWKNYWSQYDGLYPVGTVLKCGDMLMDYTYGLAVGFTIENTAPSNLNVQLNITNPGSVAILRCNGNFSGRYVASDVRPALENAIKATANIMSVTSAETGKALTMTSGAVTIGPGQKRHFVIYGDDFLSLPNYYPNVTTGKTIYPTIVAGLSDYIDTITVEAKN